MSASKPFDNQKVQLCDQEAFALFLESACQLYAKAGRLSVRKAVDSICSMIGICRHLTNSMITELSRSAGGGGGVANGGGKPGQSLDEALLKYFSESRKLFTHFKATFKLTDNFSIDPMSLPTEIAFVCGKDGLLFIRDFYLNTLYPVLVALISHMPEDRRAKIKTVEQYIAETCEYHGYPRPGSAAARREPSFFTRDTHANVWKSVASILKTKEETLLHLPHPAIVLSLISNDMFAENSLKGRALNVVKIIPILFSAWSAAASADGDAVAEIASRPLSSAAVPCFEDEMFIIRGAPKYYDQFAGREHAYVRDTPSLLVCAENDATRQSLAVKLSNTHLTEFVKLTAAWEDGVPLLAADYALASQVMGLNTKMIESNLETGPAYKKVSAAQYQTLAACVYGRFSFADGSAGQMSTRGVEMNISYAAYAEFLVQGRTFELPASFGMLSSDEEGDEGSAEPELDAAGQDGDDLAPREAVAELSQVANQPAAAAAPGSRDKVQLPLTPVGASADSKERPRSKKDEKVQQPSKSKDEKEKGKKETDKKPESTKTKKRKREPEQPAANDQSAVAVTQPKKASAAPAESSDAHDDSDAAALSASKRRKVEPVFTEAFRNIIFSVPGYTGSVSGADTVVLLANSGGCANYKAVIQSFETLMGLVSKQIEAMEIMTQQNGLLARIIRSAIYGPRFREAMDGSDPGVNKVTLREHVTSLLIHLKDFVSQRLNFVDIIRADGFFRKEQSSTSVFLTEFLERSRQIREDAVFCAQRTDETVLHKYLKIVEGNPVYPDSWAVWFMRTVGALNTLSARGLLEFLWLEKDQASHPNAALLTEWFILNEVAPKTRHLYDRLARVLDRVSQKYLAPHLGVVIPWL